MSDLDRQLDSIIRYVLEQGMLSGNGFLRSDGIAKSVAQINQAFTDAGYIKEIDVSMPAYTNYERPVMMTGQDWYDRFKAELPEDRELRVGQHKTSVDRRRLAYNNGLRDATLAAQRAANINEQENN